jgi:hypothetical protein
VAKPEDGRGSGKEATADLLRLSLAGARRSSARRDFRAQVALVCDAPLICRDYTNRHEMAHGRAALQRGSLVAVIARTTCHKGSDKGL